jgi:TPR repeat protein
MARRLALLLLLVLPGTLLATPMEQAYQAYRAGEYARAHTLWLERAEQGDANAAVNLGHLYERGLGVSRDLARALAWYEQAAERGDPHAQYQVGLMYELGMGVEPDISTADYWYERAISFGYCPGETREPKDIRRKSWTPGLR